MENLFGKFFAAATTSLPFVLLARKKKAEAARSALSIYHGMMNTLSVDNCVTRTTLSVAILSFSEIVKAIYVSLADVHFCSNGPKKGWDVFSDISEMS